MHVSQIWSHNFPKSGHIIKQYYTEDTLISLKRIAVQNSVVKNTVRAIMTEL